MTFYFRVLKAAVLVAWKKNRIQPGKETTFNFICLPHECEDLRSMNASRIISAAEVSEHYNTMCSRFFQTGLKHGLWAVTKQYYVTYRKPIRVFSSVNVQSKQVWWNEKSVFWQNHFYVSNTLCAEVYAEVVVISKSGKVSPYDAQKLMGIYVKSPEPCPEVIRERLLLGE